MKKRITRLFVLISAVAMVLTTMLVTAVYYNLFCSQVMGDLKDCSALLQVMGESGEPERFGPGVQVRGIRVTVIDSMGTVLFDNEADSHEMENHLGRPEISQAFAEGEGQAVRKSETLSRDTFYYAVRLSDGSVLRVAKDAGSIYSIFSSVAPSIIWILAALMLLSLGLSHLLTHKLLVPIERLAENMDDQVKLESYKELEPFIVKIQEQHKDIMRNARLRQEFTANVSHELKTPLTAISGYAELIETGMASEEDTVRFARGIHGSADRLLTLINDIIRLSELDSGEAEVVFENLDLYDMAASCVEMLQLSAERNGVTISVNGDRQHIRGNKQMIEELLYNLCDNAIRYNNAGGSVEVKVCSGKRKGETLLSVKDTGIGIPGEHQERIFERFYRVDKSRSKSTGGTGLGLAIVKHIVAKHGASMELESEAGKGTEIRVTFYSREGA